MPTVYLSRIFTISASHRLHSPYLTDEQNANVYGACNRPHGHGHNYDIRVTLRGAIDETTGMVMNLRVLRDIGWRAFGEALDHRHLDLDVPYFASRPSTMENLAVFVHQQLISVLVSEGFPKELLYEVQIVETAFNSVIYRGEN